MTEVLQVHQQQPATERNADIGIVVEAETQCQEHTETKTEPVIDIVINNVVCSFTTRCHLNLRKIATEGINVEYKRENGMVSMKIRHPKATASIWSSGKITCTGATSEEEAKKAGRKVARALQKLGFNVKFQGFRVVNVLATCILPFAIRIQAFSDENRNNASYEPELHPGVTYKIKDPKATLKVFSTGSITVTAPRVSNVQSAIEHVYPLVYEHKMYKPPSKVKTLPEAAVEVSGPTKMKQKKPKITKSIDLDEEDECSSFESSGDESYSSDASFD